VPLPWNLLSSAYRITRSEAVRPLQTMLLVRNDRGGSVGSEEVQVVLAIVLQTVLLLAAQSRTYGSISAAHQAARINDETVRDGTLWTGVARTESLAALDVQAQRH
jgi:hypothetical protein